MVEAVQDRDRPSRHGAILGRMLATLVEAGRSFADDLPEPCATCAFRPGCMANQNAGTGLIAMNCSIGLDDADFGCHHGMREGEPTKLCAGWVRAKLAPFATVKTALIAMQAELDAQTGPDEIRSAFDAWIARVDPDGVMDDYQRGRLYLRDSARAQTPSGDL